jgi:hypothetical protein
MFVPVVVLFLMIVLPHLLVAALAFVHGLNLSNIS